MRYSLPAAILGVLLFFPTVLRAEIWHCQQENGTDLFTNFQPDPGKCEKYTPNAEVIPAPSPATPYSEGYSQETPPIQMPYARNGSNAPEYYDPSYPYPGYYYSPYGVSPFYGGFFGFRPRPHFHHGSGARHHSGASRHSSGRR